VPDVQGKCRLARAWHSVNEDNWRATAILPAGDRFDDTGTLGIPAEEISGWRRDVKWDTRRVGGRYRGGPWHVGAERVYQPPVCAKGLVARSGESDAGRDSIVFNFTEMTF
jgi:hypothetical protein